MPHILLYTMGHCPYCKRAKALLRKKGITEKDYLNPLTKQDARD